MQHRQISKQLTESRTRITSPMVRNAQGKLENCSLDEALTAAAKKLAELGSNCGGLMSPRMPNETIAQFQKRLRARKKVK